MWQDEAFPMQIFHLGGEFKAFWSIKQHCFFLLAVTRTLLWIQPRASVSFFLYVQDRFQSNTGWVGSQLKKGYWKFFNLWFSFFVVVPFFFFFPTRIGKCQLFVGVCRNRQVYSSFMYTVDANGLEIRIHRTGLHLLHLLSGEEFM